MRERRRERERVRRRERERERGREGERERERERERGRDVAYLPRVLSCFYNGSLELYYVISFRENLARIWGRILQLILLSFLTRFFFAFI